MKYKGILYGKSGNKYFPLLMTTDDIDGLKTENIRLKKAIKNNSDGYHTFEELYQHRTYLFSIICKQNNKISWIANKHNDGTMFDGCFLAGITTPTGFYTYHCENKYKNWFDGVPELELAPEWDGHKSDDFKRVGTIKAKI